MRAVKLLLAGGGEALGAALAEVLEEESLVRLCATGQEALNLLREDVWDVLVLELTVPELDGISLLQAAAQEGLCPRVLALTPFVNDYVLSSVQALGVDYLMYLPCDIRAVAARAADLARPGRLLQRPGDRALVSALLHSLGIRSKHDGYAYLRQAIALWEPGQSVTKVLYPAVAARFGCSARQVERSIRNALDVAWRDRDARLWQRYFPRQDGRPTNAEFIARMAEWLELDRDISTTFRQYG